MIYRNLEDISRRQMSVQSQRDLRNVMSREVATTGANAVDEQGVWQDKVDDDANRMGIYRNQIQTIDGNIQ